jgi:hypothetical protein
MATANNNRFRGQGKDVRHCDSTEAMLHTAEMHWKTVPLPMLIQSTKQQADGTYATRPSQFKSLVRSDNGYELACATDTYVPTHNFQIVDAMKRAAGAGEMTITHLGSLDHGRRIFASCDMGAEFTLGDARNDIDWSTGVSHAHGSSGEAQRVGLDKVQLHGIMGSGHVPGISFTFVGMAERFVCLNGNMLVKSARARYNMRHVTEFDAHQAMRLRQVIREIKEEFDNYRAAAQKLRAAKWDSEVTRAFCCELLAPQFFAEAMRNTGFTSLTSLVDAPKHNYTLDEVLQRSAIYLNGQQEVRTASNQVVKSTRPAARVLELVNSQPGADMARGTAWGVLNAITYDVDHMRGRGESSAVESSMFGEGANLKAKALELALEYTAAIYN